MLGDGSPSTPAEASYGTPELALAVASLAAEGENAGGVMVLAGHDEGALAYGPSVRETMELILALYDKYAFNI